MAIDDDAHDGMTDLPTDRVAIDRLMQFVYQELRALASYYLRGERDDHTLQPTALVHEAWLRLSGSPGVSWQNRAHFFGAAARAMRRILVERARRRAARKRRPSIDCAAGAGGNPGGRESPDHILLIHESLEQLEREDPDAAQVVMLKFFGGLASAEIARSAGCSVRSVERRWTFAKARLYQMMRGEGLVNRPVAS